MKGCVYTHMHSIINLHIKCVYIRMYSIDLHIGCVHIRLSVYYISCISSVLILTAVNSTNSLQIDNAKYVAKTHLMLIWRFWSKLITIAALLMFLYTQ